MWPHAGIGPGYTRNKAYLFCGDQYGKWDLATDTLANQPVKHLKTGFTTVPFPHIDSVLMFPNAGLVEKREAPEPEPAPPVKKRKTQPAKDEKKDLGKDPSVILNQVDGCHNVTMKNPWEDFRAVFTVTYSNWTNYTFPEGNPAEITVEPRTEITKMLAKIADKTKSSKYGWKWAYRSAYVEQEVNPNAFRDKDFPHEMSSIGKSESSFSCSAKVDLWIPARNLGHPSRAALFDKIDPRDVKQGAVGNCWLMAAFADIAEHPAVLQELFIDKEINETGKYRIKIYDMKERAWTTVTIDEFVPCVKNASGQPQPLFSKPVGEELWVLLLEKAFAKFCGSYGKLSGGDATWAYVGLTGEEKQIKFSKLDTGNWRREMFDRDACVRKGNATNPSGMWWSWKNNDTFDADAFWLVLKKHWEDGHLMACSITLKGNPKGEEGQASQGLVTRHCYSVLRTAQVTLADGGTERLIELRNPWGNDKEWTGDWGDASPKWGGNPKVAEQLGHTDAADGDFWMSFQDWANHFNNIGVCDKHMKFE